MKPGSGHIELVGTTWYLRIRRRKVNRETGEIVPTQERIPLGLNGQIRSTVQARRIADRWLASQSPETLQPGMNVTAAEYFAHFVAMHVARMRPSSQKRYRSTINQHLMPEFGCELLEVIDATRIQRYIIAIAQKRARATVKTIVSTLMQILAKARFERYAVHRIEPKAVKLPNAWNVGKPQRHINAAELEQILAASVWPWLALWAVMAYAGLRISEALGLTWENVDLERGVIKVRQQAVHGRLSLPKTKTSRADVPILPELDQVLRAYLDHVGGERATGLLFRARNGSPLRADNVRYRQLHPMLGRLRIPRAGLHAFRHGLPGQLDLIGISPGVIQKCMRHASLAQTEAYLHVGNDDVRAAIDAAKNRGERPATENRP